MAAPYETILVTGGLGYIGSHLCDRLMRHNHRVIVLDNLSNSSMNKIRRGCKFYKEDIRSDIRYIFKNNKIDRVIHLAALKSVPQSEDNKDEYYSVNVLGTQNLVWCMQDYCRRIEFASSASVYGKTPVPAAEDRELNPLSYYAHTKVLGEKIIKESGLDYTIFRYFNPVGYSKHIPDTSKSVFSILLEYAEKNKTFTICGDKYDTVDGTCVRDYIDIHDLISVHELNLRGIYNVGSGNAVSVKQLVEKFNDWSPNKIKFEFGKPRVGDPGIEIGDCSKIFAAGLVIKTDLKTSFENLFPENE